MRIKFNDTGEEYEVTGEKPQFWLFNFPDGRKGKAVKGGHSYKLIKEEEEEVKEEVEETEDIIAEIPFIRPAPETQFGLPHVDEEIQIREELSDFEESSNEES